MYSLIMHLGIARRLQVEPGLALKLCSQTIKVLIGIHQLTSRDTANITL